MSGMSYSVNVTVKDGTATATASSGTPDGTFSITGHDDASVRSLSVQLNTGSGEFVAASSLSVRKEA
jgi:hypothetical protein